LCCFKNIKVFYASSTSKDTYDNNEWDKLFIEKVYLMCNKNYPNVDVRLPGLVIYMVLISKLVKK